MAAFGVLFISLPLRTQVRPAIEFVSGKEGLRPRIPVFVSWYFCLRVLVFLEFAYWDTLKFARAPGLCRGEMAMAVASSACLAFLRGAVCACCMPYTRCFPFLVPVQRWSNELPATTVGERRRRHSLQSHKGGPETILFNVQGEGLAGVRVIYIEHELFSSVDHVGFEADVDIWTATMASTSSQLDEKVADLLYRRGPDQPSSSSLARRVRVQPLLLSLLLFVR